jgi:hypothetical protein
VSSPIQRIHTQLDQLNKARHLLTDDELWDRYKNIFQSYFSKTSTPPKPVVEIEAATASIDSNWLKYIPKTYRARGLTLNRLLNASINQQTAWSVMGEDGKLVHNDVVLGGNIYEMLIYASSRRKQPREPEAYAHFKQLLLDLNIPQNLLARRKEHPSPYRIKKQTVRRRISNEKKKRVRISSSSDEAVTAPTSPAISPHRVLKSPIVKKAKKWLHFK